jgi:hypothetical protein
VDDSAVEDSLLSPEESVEGDELDFVDEGIEHIATNPVDDWSPAATFDVLFLTSALGRQSPPSNIELHTFAYLACLLSVFRGRPASEWGYTFSAIPPTLPFSPGIEAALAELVASGLIQATAPVLDEDTDGVMLARHQVVDAGSQELAVWRGLTTFSGRVAYLEAATKTAVFSSLPGVVNSLSNEPQLRLAMRTDGPRMLLTSVTSGPLYEQFGALVEALGPEHEELVVPASLYLNFLTQQARERLDALLDVQEDDES